MTHAFPYYVIVANPTSGKGRGRRFAEKLRDELISQAPNLQHQELPKAGVALHFTNAPGDAERIVGESCSANNRPRVVVACGGDGTIHQVVNALMRLGSDRPVLALAPAGRCNDFARALGISLRLSAIMGVLRDGKVRNLDLGRVNDRYFCTIAAIGIDAEISSFVHRSRLPLKGTAAYLYAAVRTLISYQAREVTLRGDFGEIRRRTYLVSTANTHSYGGNIRLLPQADPFDGLLNACAIEAMSRINALAMIPRVLLRKHSRNRRVEILSTRGFNLECDRTLEIWADGECVGCTPARIEVVPQALQILVP